MLAGQRGPSRRGGATAGSRGSGDSISFLGKTHAGRAAPSARDESGRRGGGAGLPALPPGASLGRLGSGLDGEGWFRGRVTCSGVELRSPEPWRVPDGWRRDAHPRWDWGNRGQRAGSELPGLERAVLVASCHVQWLCTPRPVLVCLAELASLPPAQWALTADTPLVCVCVWGGALPFVQAFRSSLRPARTCLVPLVWGWPHRGSCSTWEGTKVVPRGHQGQPLVCGWPRGGQVAT